MRIVTAATPGRAHGMADLVQSDHHVSRGIEAGNGGALMRIDAEAAVVARLGAYHHGEFGSDVGTERGIDAVEGQIGPGRRRYDPIVLDTKLTARPLREHDAKPRQLGAICIVERAIGVG